MCHDKNGSKIEDDGYCFFFFPPWSGFLGRRVSSVCVQVFEVFPTVPLGPAMPPRAKQFR